MTVDNSQNLNAHYSSNHKVKRPKHSVASAPNALPRHRLYNDSDANSRMNAINQDIYLDSKREKSKKGKTFTKYFVGGIIAILAFLGLKKIFKKS